MFTNVKLSEIKSHARATLKAYPDYTRREAISEAMENLIDLEAKLLDADDRDYQEQRALNQRSYLTDKFDFI